MGSTRRFAVALTLICAALGAAPAYAQSGVRRLTTVDSIRQFPGYYHLQQVLVRGTVEEAGQRLALKADDREITAVLDSGVNAASGTVEVRGQVIDIGRLEPGDPRAGMIDEGRTPDRWPRPGEELVLRVSAVSEAPPQLGPPTIRALALEPWRFVGQTVTVTGNFRGRNLFGDLPGAPAQGRYDFVLRATDAAIWVTGQRPRGRGFDLDVDRRIDSNRWLEVTGTVVQEKGLVRIEAARLAAAVAQTEAPSPDERPAPAAVAGPLEVVFFTPADGETDVSPSSTVRLQFSRGLAEPTLTGRVQARYQGTTDGPDLTIRTTYDAANRAVEVRFAEPLEPYRTVEVRLLEGITAFDGGALAPWTLTFSVGQ